MGGIFRLPLIPVFIVYTIGIYSGHLELPLLPRGWIFLAILLGSWAIFLLANRTRPASWIALFLFFLLGIVSLQLYLPSHHPPSHISRFTGAERISLEGVVDRPPESARGRTQLFIRSQKVILPSRALPVEGLLLIFWKGEDPSLRVGDYLRFRCRLYPPGGFHNPGGFSYERHLAFERIYTVGFVSEEGWVKLGEGFKNPVTLRVERWRDRIRDFLTREAPPASSSIFKALVLGEQGDIPEEIKEYFVLTGTAHLLAISGDQFGIVAFLSFSLLIWILKRSEFLLLSIPIRKWAAGLTIPCIVLYAFIAGAGISVIRAAIMVITFLISILLDRERNMLHTLALAAFLILLFSPPSLFDVSFQLSFLAVFWILYLVPRILQEFKRDKLSLLLKASWKKKIVNYLGLSLLVTGVAILGTAPFVALHFNRFAPIGFVTNLFIVPWVGFVIVPLSLAASIFSFFLLPFASFLVNLNSIITLALVKVLEFLASLPFASFFVSTPTPFEIVLFYALLFLVAHLRKRRRIRYFFIGLCLILACDLTYWSLKDLFQKDLKITFIDVGHGDSILIEFPKGKKMLVDGGGLYDDRFDIGQRVIAPFLWRNKIRRIDVLALTHPDPDHLKGLNFIASQFSIGQFWDNGYQTQSEPYLRLQETLREKKIKTQSLNDASPSRVINGVEIVVLNPPLLNAWQGNVRKLPEMNNASLVLQLRFENISVLLTGDIGKEAEGRIARKDHPLRADILKIPHHGSSSSSSLPFLQRVNPVYAILSVGERNIGKLPHPEVLKRYEQLGTSVYRTDKQGAITVVTDGKDIRVMPFLNSKE